MKKPTLILALALGLVCLTGQAFAATTGAITVTVSLEESISVSLSSSVWNIGPIALSGSSGPQAFTATNDGNVTIDLAIKASNGANSWTLGDPAAADTFKVTVASPALTLTTTNQSLATSVAVAGTAPIGLTYAAPTSDTQGGGVDHSFSVTVTASKTP